LFICITCLNGIMEYGIEKIESTGYPLYIA